MQYKRTLLITGGAGFIGSHVVRLMVNKYPDYRIINLDKLTYAGNLANLKDIEQAPNYLFVREDICDYERIREVLTEYEVDGIIHLAAESHVDRSIRDPFTFAKTNVLGTLSLLQAAREVWEARPEKVSASIISLPTKSMGHSTSMERSSPRRASMIRTALTLRVRPPATTSSVPITIPTGCLRW